MAYNDFWRRVGRGLQSGSGAFMDIYRTLSALEEAEQRRKEDARQFDAMQALRLAEQKQRAGEFSAESNFRERQAAERSKQLGVAALQDSGLRGTPDVLASLITPPKLGDYYQAPTEGPDFPTFGQSLDPEPVGFDAPPSSALSALSQAAVPSVRTPDAFARHRGAMDQNLDMQRELGRRQIAIRQRQADPGYLAGAPMALDAPVLEQGGPTYGEFRGVGQEDLTHVGLRPQDMSPYQRAMLDRQERQMRYDDYLSAMRSRLSSINGQRDILQRSMNELQQNAYDSRMQAWNNPAAEARFRQYQLQLQGFDKDYSDIERELLDFQRQQFGNVGGPKQEGPPPRDHSNLPGPRAGHGGASPYPPIMEGETNKEYAIRLIQALRLVPGSPEAAEVIQAALRNQGRMDYHGQGY